MPFFFNTDTHALWGLGTGGVAWPSFASVPIRQKTSYIEMTLDALALSQGRAQQGAVFLGELLLPAWQSIFSEGHVGHRGP